MLVLFLIVVLIFECINSYRKSVPEVEDFDYDSRHMLFSYGIKFLILMTVVSCFSSEATIEVYLFYVVLIVCSLPDDLSDYGTDCKSVLMSIGLNVFIMAVILFLSFGLSKSLKLITNAIVTPTTLGEYSVANFLMVCSVVYSVVIVAGFILNVISGSQKLWLRPKRDTRTIGLIASNIVLSLLLIGLTWITNLNFWVFTADRMTKESASIFEYCKSIVPSTETLRASLAKDDEEDSGSKSTEETEKDEEYIKISTDFCVDINESNINFKYLYGDIYGVKLCTYEDCFNCYIVETDSSEESCLKDLVQTLECTEKDASNPIVMIKRVLRDRKDCITEYTNYKDTKGMITQDILNSTVLRDGQVVDKEGYHANFALLTTILLRDLKEHSELTFCPFVDENHFPIYHSTRDNLYYAYVVLHQKDYLQILCMYQKIGFYENIKIDYYTIFKPDSDVELMNFYQVFDLSDSEKVMSLISHKQTHELADYNNQQLEIVQDYWELSPEYLKD